MRADAQNNVDKIQKSLALLAQRMDRETAPIGLRNSMRGSRTPDCGMIRRRPRN